jgi:hypothetical protein
MAHTPGPWIIAEQDNSIWTIDGKQVAHCMSEPGCGMVWDKKTISDNAKLVSASPKLLEACKLAYEVFDLCGLASPQREYIKSQIAAAIADAEST